MVSIAMAVQDQRIGSRSNTVLTAGNGDIVTAGLYNVTRQEQFPCGHDYAPKVRKPYTITKQRERWTDEEHKKFIEALKLYGRAWRRIEEYVGTKTAVQIRSHAQKFFSKVVRETSGSNTSSVEPIEIPPPRPKRKPMHPYPRKLAHLTIKQNSNPEQTRRSSSPNLSISEQDNQSPTSVLSAVGSDALGSTDSDAPNCSLSPVSSAACLHVGRITILEPCSLPEENGSSTAVPVTAGAVADEKCPMKVELFPQENMFPDGVSAEETTPRSLKLFGRTVLVTGSDRPASPNITAFKLPSEMNKGKPVQPLPRKLVAVEALSRNSESIWSHPPHKMPGAFYYLQNQNEKSNQETGSVPSLSCWTFYGGIQLPVQPFQKQDPTLSHVDSNIKELQEKEFQKEGSWTGSNSGSVNDRGDAEKNSDVETESCQLSLVKEEKETGQVFEFKPSERSAFSEIRASAEKLGRGFVPYKKRRMPETDTQSSTITDKDGVVEHEIRLCL